MIVPWRKRNEENSMGFAAAASAAVLGWIVTIIVTSAMLFCGLGLGFSVALRKKGKSKKSFIVQFAGLLGIGLTVGLYCLFVGSLIAPLN